jgi:hypothetical protein
MADEWSINTEDWAIADEGVYVDNPEFIYVKTDNEDKILWAIKIDGSIYYGAGVPQQIIDYINEKIAELSLDEYEDIVAFLNGLEEGDKTLQTLLNEKVDKEEGKSLIDEEYASSQSAIENPENISIVTDSEDKILAGRTPDGAAFENVGFSTPKVSIDGHTIKNIEDPEGRTEILTDAEGKIISFRDKDGVLNENVGIRTNSLELSSKGMSEFQQALIDNGFTPGGAGDWSHKNIIYLTLPNSNLPIVNIICDTIPTLKEDSYNAVMEYWDGNGNYFKKDIKKFGCQGRTTMAYPKKNFKFDFSDCKIKFGNWVMQDSFHLKANYLDIIRGKSNVAYDYFLDIISYNKEIQDVKPWIKTNISDYCAYGGKKNDNLDFTTDARGIPAGFAVRLFMNGSFYGIYTFNLKKDRDNYAMSKSKAKHIHIDPENLSTILGGQTPDWTQFEIRNPKGLVDVDGNEYDGDDPKELTGDSAVDALSAQVKQYILDFSAANGRLYDNNVTTADYEAVYDVNWNIDFTIFQNVILDGDGIGSNTQYCTWDGVIWYPMPYDLDQIFGNQSKGNFIARVTRDHLSMIVGIDIGSVGYTRKLYDFYKARIDARYKELRDSGIISVPYLMEKIKKYIDNLGSAAMKEELTKWPETPCYRSPNTNSQWLFLGQNYTDHQATVYDDSVTYHVGDVVTWGYMDYPYQCLEECTGVPPMSEYYNEAPRAGGFYDSIERMEIWLKERIAFIDTYYNYNQN